MSKRAYNTTYRREHLNYVAFPLGGLGAGMFCIEGSGQFSHVSLRHRPEVANDAKFFAALCVKGRRPVARVLEGPVPRWKVFSRAGAGNGSVFWHAGLPRCAEAEFAARFPFATVTLRDRRLGVQVELAAWSPFVPGDADASSLPVAALEYRFTNSGPKAVSAVFSCHSLNFMSAPPEKGTPRGDRVRRTARGFVLEQEAYATKPAAAGAFSVECDTPGVRVDGAMFRGGWFDPLTLTWKHIAAGECLDQEVPASGDPSPGASLYVPLELAPGATQTVRLRLAWYVPTSELRVGADAPAPAAPAPAAATCTGSCTCAAPPPQHYRPWYAAAFASVDAVAAHWATHYDDLRARSLAFSDCFHDTTLAPEAIEAVAANLSILKSPTILRQHDGRVWAWEGCHDSSGCCHGTCTHVWNYAQALCHLFPALERTLRETEFEVSQDARGHQNFRSALPLRPTDHQFHAAADGQLGGIIKVHREWRISGDTAWLRRLWPRVQQSLDYGIATWDPDERGALVEPHHNTYDIEFWGPDGMCTSFYLGALAAAVAMGRAVGADVTRYETLLARGRAFMESALWNGEYFYQQVQWQGLRAGDPTQAQTMGAGYSAEAQAILRREGPKYQYGTGCLTDGVLGAFLAAASGVGEVLDAAKVAAHLLAVHRHNLKRDLSTHANPQRPSFALGREGGTLLCSWPRGGKPSLPFPYSDEVWTGIEYQAAAHLLFVGRLAEALAIVRAARDRYDGTCRNPFNEYECGHWYGRALASYALLQGLSGARYDAVTRTLHLAPPTAGDFRAFLCTATGYGTVGVRGGQPFWEVKAGTLPIAQVAYTPAAQG